MVSLMEGRRDDTAPDGRFVTSAPPDPAGRAEGAATPPVAEVAPSRSRSVWLVVGLVLAAAGTAAVLTTDNPAFLRVALLAVCWAFVITAFLASGRRADQLAAAGREAELRHAYELEIEREVAARHEYQLQLESRLRRNTED